MGTSVLRARLSLSGRAPVATPSGTRSPRRSARTCTTERRLGHENRDVIGPGFGEKVRVVAQALGRRGDVDERVVAVLEGHHADADGHGTHDVSGGPLYAAEKSVLTVTVSNWPGGAAGP